MLIKPFSKTFPVTLVVVLFVGLLVSNLNVLQSNTAMAEITPINANKTSCSNFPRERFV